ATADGYRCTIRNRETRQISDITARIVILAHGSWDVGGLPTQRERPAAGPGDLLAFKAHFVAGSLPIGLMPLLAFPGGYGGMVHGARGRFSVSYCIRRDRLATIRRDHPGFDAGESVQAYLQDSMRGF